MVSPLPFLACRMASQTALWLEQANERIIGSKLEWLSPAHHVATLEHPEAFNTMLSRFLAMQSKD